MSNVFNSCIILSILLTIFLTTLALPLTPTNEQPPSLYLWNATHLHHLRQLISTNQTLQRSTSISLQHLHHLVTRDLSRIQQYGLPSVTNKSTTAPGTDNDLHYFTSLVPYAFPCTNLPDGCIGYDKTPQQGTVCNPKNGLPWKICDGKLNYRMLFPDRKALERMIHYTIRFSIYAYLLQHPQTLKTAVQLLDTWFLNTTTRMYPSLQFAQGIPGITNGKHSGCMDLYFFGRGFTDAVALLAQTPGSDQYLTKPHRIKLSQWFAQMAAHMVQSPQINPESKMKNNHGVYYDLTVTSLALLAGDQPSLAIVHKISGGRDCWKNRDRRWCLRGRLESQVDTDGRFKYETHRADPGHYVWYTLLANSYLTTFANRIPSLENFDNDAIVRAADWALPHALNSRDAWITGQHIYAVHAYRMLAVNTGFHRYERIVCELQKALSHKASHHFWENDKVGMEVLQLTIPPLDDLQCSAWDTFLQQYPDHALSKLPLPISNHLSNQILDKHSGPGLFTAQDVTTSDAATHETSMSHYNFTEQAPMPLLWLCLVIPVVLFLLRRQLGSWRKVRRKMGTIVRERFWKRVG